MILETTDGADSNGSGMIHHTGMFFIRIVGVHQWLD